MCYNAKHLINDLSSGKEEGYKYLYEKYYAYLCSYAFRILANREESKEVVQEIFIKIWNGREKLPKINNIEAYLIKAVKNEAVNHLKKQKNDDHEKQELMILLKTKELGSEDMIYKKEVADEMDKAINTLSDKTKEAFVLKRLEGKSLKEVASIMNISEKGVERNITRALKELKKVLKNCFFIF
jgi:RNA polymerase sigma-70 factor (ECF subfamily)